MSRPHITTVERGEYACPYTLRSETLALFPNTSASKAAIHLVWPHAAWDIVDIPGNILRVVVSNYGNGLVVYDAPSYTLSDARLQS